MPIVNGQYQNPGWIDGQEPAIDAEELNAISNTLVALPSQIYSNVSYSGVNPGWVLLQSYTTANSYTWTAPDLFNGKEYYVGVAVIGGGGSGGAVSFYTAGSSATPYSSASGGASGYAKYFIYKVTPNSGYSIVVGAGGNSVTSSSGNLSSGLSGGSSSFNGITAEGGSGGTSYGTNSEYNVSSADSAQGGQCSDSAMFISTTSPYGGRPECRNSEPYGSLTYPGMCINPFTMEPCLIAGGSIYNRSTTSKIQTPISGLSVGTGSPASKTTSGTKGTAPGCGGGGTAYMTPSYPPTPASSAAGADGAVLIYILGGGQS